jgi:hypothetical protein
MRKRRKRKKKVIHNSLEIYFKLLLSKKRKQREKNQTDRSNRLGARFSPDSNCIETKLVEKRLFEEI